MPKDNVQDPTNNKSSKKVVAILLTILAVAAIGGVYYWGNSQSRDAKKARDSIRELETKLDGYDTKISDLNKELTLRKATTGEASINKNGFQAVFLKSGQVYFGKITAISETQLTLENIYYLKENSGNDPTLVKLGSEVHGPEDKMFIERAQIEFWENSKESSQVVKAIREYEKQKP